MIKKRCKGCRYHSLDEKQARMITLEKGKDPVLFRPCVNPDIDGVQNKYHKATTMVICKSKAKTPMMTHANFGCGLFVKLLMALFVFAMLFQVGHALAAGTVVVTTDTTYTRGDWSKGVREILWTWTSTDGTATATGGFINAVTGTIIGIYAVPSTVNLPDDDYDIDILDAGNSHDVLNGAGDSLPQSAVSDENRRFPVDWLNSGPIFLVNETLSFNGANLNTAGTATGKLYVYILLP